MANVIKIKRTSVSGRAANTSTLTNAGELALNMADGILYSGNGSAVFEIGANNTNVNITGNATIKAISANGSLGSAGQTLASNGSAIYWATSGTVSNVATGDGLTGGPITSTGTISVLANTGIVANATGLYVNSAYIGTLTANNTNFVGSVSAANVVSNAQLSANLASYLTKTGVNTANGNFTYYSNTSNTAFTITLSPFAPLGNQSFSFYTAGVLGVTQAAMSWPDGTIQSTAWTGANTGLVANSSGTFVNATYIGTLSANNASYLGGTAASGYQTTAGLSANVATLAANSSSYTTSIVGGLAGSIPYQNAPGVTTFVTIGTSTYIMTSNGSVPQWTNPTSVTVGAANNASYLGGTIASSFVANTSGGLTQNTSGHFIVANSGIIANATGVFVNAAYINTISSNNSSYLNGQPASYYTNASNITTGTLPWAQVPSGTVNTSGAFTIGGVLTRSAAEVFNNNVNLNFKALSGANVSFVQQSDDNFVFYSTNTSGGQRAVWSIYANSGTSSFSLSVPAVFNNGLTILGGGVTLGSYALSANGSAGGSGQVLTSNGSATYWSTVSGGSGSVNTSAQFTWTNTHTFQANVSFTGNNISLVSNTGSVFFGGGSDSNWRIGRSTGAFTKFFYTNNSLDIVAAGSPLEGFAIGQPGANSYLETGYNGTYTRNPIYVGNSTVNTTINATSFTGTANNASYLGGTAAASYQLNSTLAANVATLAANSATYVLANTGIVSNATGVYVNSTYIGTLSANNASYLGGTAAASYQLNSTLAANVATLAANSATYVLANTGIVSNATGVYVNSAYINTISSNNSSYLGGVAASGYANTSNPTFTTGVTVGNATVNIAISTSTLQINGETAVGQTAITAGTYGNSTAIPVITLDKFGRVTTISTSAGGSGAFPTGDYGDLTSIVQDAFGVNIIDITQFDCGAAGAVSNTDLGTAGSI